MAKALPPEQWTVYGDIIQETEDAILLSVDGDVHWLPKSESDYNGARGDTGVEVTIPDWLAKDKGLEDGDGLSVPPPPPPADLAEPESAPADAKDRPVLRQHPGLEWLGEETITVSHSLTDKEKAEYAVELAELDGEIKYLEDERKALGNSINLKKKQCDKIAQRIREGADEEEVLCDKCADFAAGEMKWADAYTGTILNTRPLTAEERQMPLPGVYKLIADANVGTPEPDDTAEEDAASTLSEVPAETPAEAPATENGHICIRCKHSDNNIAMPPCAGCALNPDPAHSGDKDEWQSRDEAVVDAETDGTKKSEHSRRIEELDKLRDQAKSAWLSLDLPLEDAVNLAGDYFEHHGNKRWTRAQCQKVLAEVEKIKAQRDESHAA